jgi:hypothetical protein
VKPEWLVRVSNGTLKLVGIFKLAGILELVKTC